MCIQDVYPPPVSPAALFPRHPGPHHAHTASNAAFISSIAEARCPLHSGSLIFIDWIPGQSKLRVPEHIWEG